MTRLCESLCQPVGGPSYRRVSPKPMGPGGCTRWGKYTDGRNVYCTQHAKEFATVMAKATQRIREGLYPIPTEDEADALCAADERKAEGR